MYETLKNILPRNFLKTNEAFMRKIIYIFYKGSNKQCTVCDKKLKRFVTLKNGDSLCPYCGSLPRHRQLWILLKPSLLPGIRILDFSPPLCIYKKLKFLQQIDYTATDYEGEFAADRSFDITKIQQQADNFDLIICYHILEHIIDDEKAITELYRVLKPKGKCFIQTPFKEGDIYEDPSKQSKQERKQAFGQEDHVRVYSIKGLKKRLEKAGFQVEVLSFSEADDNRFGFNAKEHVLLATK